MIVVDASAAVHFLAGGDSAEWVADQVAERQVNAPHLLDVEVASTLRNFVLRGELGEERVRLALDDLETLDLERYPHLPFIERIWGLRKNLTPYDAAYVALAEALDCPLVTTDLRIARVPNLRTTVLTPGP